MKSNTALKIVTLCVICAAIVMSGCLTSDDITTSVDAPFTVTIPMGDPTSTADYTYTLEFSIKEGGEMEYGMYGLGEDVCGQGTWTQGSSSDEYVLMTADIHPDDAMHLTIYDDGTVIVKSNAADVAEAKGTWTSVDRTSSDTTADVGEKPVATPTKAKLVSTPRPTPKATLAPTENDESGFTMEYPFLVTIEGSGIQEGVNFVMMIDDDGETGYLYTWCGFNIATAQEIKMFDVTYYDDRIIYRGNYPDGLSISITAYETERGGGRAKQLGFDDDPDCTWNPWDNVPTAITDKILAYNQEWL